MRRRGSLARVSIVWPLGRHQSGGLFTVVSCVCGPFLWVDCFGDRRAVGCSAAGWSCLGASFRVWSLFVSQPPDSGEVLRAINQMSSSKAPGPDGLPPELFKSGGSDIVNKLTSLYQSIRSNGTVPQEFKDALIVHIFKRKGDRSVCDDHRGISLLSIPGKILARE